MHALVDSTPKNDLPKGAEIKVSRYAQVRRRAVVGLRLLGCERSAPVVPGALCDRKRHLNGIAATAGPSKGGRKARKNIKKKG